MKFEWNKSTDIPLTQGVNDLTYTNGTYVLVSDIPTGNVGTVALSPIATSQDLIEWTVQKRINPNLKNIRLLTIDNITYYIGTEQNSAVIYSTEDNVNFTRVRKFHNFVTNTSRSRVRKVDASYIISLMGGFIMFNGSDTWNLVQLSEEYKDYYVLDTTYWGTPYFLLEKNSHYVLASYTNNELMYSLSPFDELTEMSGTYYGLASNKDQLLILGCGNLIPCILIKESNNQWIAKQLAITGDVYQNHRYLVKDGLYLNDTWVFVGVKGKVNGPDRIFITENSFIYTSENIIANTTIKENFNPSVFGLDRVYYLNNKLISLGTGYPNNDKFLVISN